MLKPGMEFFPSVRSELLREKRFAAFTRDSKENKASSERAKNCIKSRWKCVSRFSGRNGDQKKINTADYRKTGRIQYGQDKETMRSPPNENAADLLPPA